MKTHLFLTVDFPPSTGGIAREYDEITRRWTISEMLVIAPEDASAAMIPLRSILPTNVYIRWLWPHWVGMFWTALVIVVRRRISLIHVGQLLPCGTIVYLLTRLFPIPYVVYAHGTDLGAAKSTPRKRLLASRILRSASHVIVNSHYTERLAKELVGEETLITVVHPGATQLDAPAPDVLKDAQRTYQLEGKSVVLTVGRLVERKGVDMMIRAIALLPTKLRADLRYLVVGTGPDRGRLEALVRQNGLESVVRFTGSVEDSMLSALYSLCDVFSLVGRLSGEYDVEGFGIAYLEANLFGKPVLAGKTGGVADAVLDGETGILVDSLDATDVSSNLQKLLLDPALRERLGERGRARAQTLTWATTAKGCEVIAEVCQR